MTGGRFHPRGVSLAEAAYPTPFPRMSDDGVDAVARWVKKVLQYYNLSLRELT